MIYSEIKTLFGGVVMDWTEIIQVFCVPLFAYLFYQINAFRNEISDFKLKVAEDAKDYATNDAILRMESKIDDLRNLIIEEFRPKRTKK